MTATSSRSTLGTLAVCILAAGGETALLLGNAALPDPAPAGLAFLAFLIGPFAFLALAAWRRRAQPARVRLLLIVALVLGGMGLGIFTMRTLAPENLQKHPVLNPAVVPLGQWLIVLAAWVRVTAVENREKRRRSPAP